MSTDGSDEMNKIAADLAQAGATVGVRAGKILEKASADIQAQAQARAPVDTGALRSSISRSTSRAGSTVRSEIGPTVNYGRYVEEGTSRMRAQPYLRPATDAVVPGFQAAVEQLGGENL